MNDQRIVRPPYVPAKQPVRSEPVRTVGTTETTTIWRDGEVWREDRFGRVRRLHNLEAA